MRDQLRYRGQALIDFVESSSFVLHARAVSACSADEGALISFDFPSLGSIRDFGAGASDAVTSCTEDMADRVAHARFPELA
jgi:hypothetical protein